MTLLAPNNYLVDLVEQSGHTFSVYLAGAKVICNLDGVTRGAAIRSAGKTLRSGRR